MSDQVTTGEPEWGYAASHFAAALGLAVLAGGVAFFAAGAIFSFIMVGTEAFDDSGAEIAGSLIFSILLVGLCGGVPGIIMGLILAFGRVRSLIAFISAGVVTAFLAPALVMWLTPVGAAGWSMLVVAVPSGAIAGWVAWVYLKRTTTLLDAPHA